MAKPTARQLAVIDVIRNQCTFWVGSNDLHSPSHSTDIHEELGLLVLDDVITDAEEVALHDAISEVWVKVADLEFSGRQGLGVAAAEPSAGPSAVSPPRTVKDAAAVPNAATSLPVIGYFRKGGFKWNLVEVDGAMLTGYDITPLGKLHTLCISKSQVDELVMLEL